MDMDVWGWVGISRGVEHLGLFTGKNKIYLDGLPKKQIRAITGNEPTPRSSSSTLGTPSVELAGLLLYTCEFVYILCGTFGTSREH
jgi:hypothetical protein